MDFSLTPDQQAIRDAIARICARFGDDYWLGKDRSGGFLALDGVYRTTEGVPVFHAVRAPTPAELLKRLFDIDIEQCPQCGGSLKIIAAIEDPPVIAKILTHLGLLERHKGKSKP